MFGRIGEKPFGELRNSNEINGIKASIGRGNDRGRKKSEEMTLLKAQETEE